MDLETAARKGGSMLMKYFKKHPRYWSKTPYEAVSEADLESEKAIVSEIKKRFPGHTIITEEIGKLPGDPNHVWIIDPLDGTLKFLLGEPYFSISIAYEHKGIVEIGVIFNPCTDELFYARRGKGAFLNGVRLRPARNPDSKKSFVCCDWGGSKTLQKQGLAYLSKLLPPNTRGVGINFSPALDLCGVASGRIALMISNGTTPEDHSAAGLVVREAGGFVTNFSKAQWEHHEQGVVAAGSRAAHLCASKLVGSLEKVIGSS